MNSIKIQLVYNNIIKKMNQYIIRYNLYLIIYTLTHTCKRVFINLLHLIPFYQVQLFIEYCVNKFILNTNIFSITLFFLRKITSTTLSYFIFFSLNFNLFNSYLMVTSNNSICISILRDFPPLKHIIILEYFL